MPPFRPFDGKTQRGQNNFDNLLLLIMISVFLLVSLFCCCRRSTKPQVEAALFFEWPSCLEVVDLLQTTYLDPGIVSVESSLCDFGSGIYAINYRADVS